MASFTQEQFDALNAAIAEGALTVKYSDKEVTYRSLNDMLRTRALIAKDLGLLCDNAGRRYAVYNSGLKHSGEGNTKRYGEF